MPLSPRGKMATGLGLVVAGLIVAVSQSIAQPPDPNLRKTAAPNPAASAAARPARPAPPTAVIGTVDLDSVLKGYEKFKDQYQQFSAQVMAEQEKLTKFAAEIKVEIEKLSKLKPDGPDYKKLENTITEMKAKHEALRQKAERDFTRSEAEMNGALFREVQDTIGRVAQYFGMTYVVKLGSEPASTSSPEAVMMAMSRTVLYADPRADITQTVIATLNRDYRATKKPAEAATPAPAPATPGAPR